MENKVRNIRLGRRLKAVHKRTDKSCSICGKSFRIRFTHDRFCGTCKSHSELYLYSEWLPQFAFA